MGISRHGCSVALLFELDNKEHYMVSELGFENWAVLQARQREMASYSIMQPEPFDFTRSEDWPKWIRRFESFRQASNLSSKSDVNQVYTLIYSMGDLADDILRSFRLSSEEETYDAVTKKFEDHFVKCRNIIFERARFNQRR